jgi:hypothetical protein
LRRNAPQTATAPINAPRNENGRGNYSIAEIKFATGKKSIFKTAARQQNEREEAGVM